MPTPQVQDRDGRGPDDAYIIHSPVVAQTDCNWMARMDGSGSIEPRFMRNTRRCDPGHAYEHTICQPKGVLSGRSLVPAVLDLTFRVISWWTLKTSKSIRFLGSPATTSGCTTVEHTFRAVANGVEKFVGLHF